MAKKDEKTVTLTLAYPSALLAARLAVVKIVPKAVVTADAKAFDAKPIGTGPWKLTDNGATSKQVTFERNDAYTCLLYTSPSPRDRTRYRMPSSA